VGNFQEVINTRPSSPAQTALVALPGAPGDVTAGFCASFFNRMQYVRWTGFQNFKNNKAFAVSDPVPAGHLWLILALSAFHLFITLRTIHFFAIPPGDADNLLNVTSDTTSPQFQGATNNPPLKSGVLLSIGGGNLADMQSQSQSSVCGLVNPIYLPERWKILACIDSGEAVSTPSADGITIDAGLIDLDQSECVPEL